MESFAEKIARLNEETREAWGEHNDKVAALLASIGHLDGRPQPGASAPPFVVPNAEGRLVSLSEDLLDERALVLAFIRGSWCPYCRAQTMAFAEAASDYTSEKIRVAIMTPEVGGRALQMKQDFHLPMEVLCDVDQGVALTYGCLVPVAQDYRSDMVAAGLDLARLYGNRAWFMPVASTFLIGADGKILRVFGTVDQRQRSDPQEVLEASTRLLAVE